MALQLPGVPDSDHDRQAKFDALALAMPGFGGQSVEVRLSQGASAAIPFAASTTGSVVVTHGMGRVPASVVATSFGAAGQAVTLSVATLTATQFTLSGTVPAAITGTVFAFWIAIG